MGSALCFPVEAMYFYTICVASLLRIQDLPVTPRNAFKVSRNVYVYGDDIIVPSAYASSVLDSLQKYNCKVNTAKTFFKGNFRESCGVDAFRGQEVTPVYVGTSQPLNAQQVSEIVSWVSTANLFYKKGLWSTADYMFKTVESVIGPLPYVLETSSGLGRISYLGYHSVERWNSRLCRFEIRAAVVKPVYRTDILEGYGALQKSFLSLASQNDSPVSRDAPLTMGDVLRGDLKPPSVDKAHLERSAWRGAIALKRRWVPAT